nr:hypothetical protein [Tanacetum cinerariifolium]
MTSFTYRLNPLYPIKKCSSCGALYTTDYCCSNGSLVDKIICDLNKAPDSPHLHTLLSNQHHCFHCKDVLGDGEICQRCTCTRCGSGLWKGLCLICKHNQHSLNTYLSFSANSSQSSPQINHHCCYGCGDLLEGIFCPQCTCKLCGNGAHYGYNCSPKVLIIPNPKPFNNQTIKELPPTMQSFDPKPDLVHKSPNVSNPPPQIPFISCEFYKNDARYGHYYTPQVPFVYPEQCYNQDFNFPKEFQEYYHEQNSCYDYNSFGFDKFQPHQYTVNHPVFNAQNELFDSQNKLIEQLTSMCDMVSQLIQKKEEEKKIEEAQAANARYWKIPACYDDDDDYNFAIPPNEPVNSLSMGDEHPDTVPATESDEFIKSSVENLVPIPSESEGIPDNMCDVPFHDNSLPLDVSKDQFKDFFDFNDEFSSIDDDSFSIDNIDYVEASPPDSELISSEVMEIVIPKTTSSSTSLNSLLEETNTFDNSLPKLETFCFDVEEISSSSTTTRSDISLPEYEAFYDDHVKEIKYDCFLFNIEPNSRDFTMDVVEDISPTREPRVHNSLPTHPTLQLNLKFQPSSESLFTYVVWIFLPFLVYSVAPQYLLSLRNEDTIFDPGIYNSQFFSFRPAVSHRCGTFLRFKVLNESLMEILSSTCSPMDQ